ncbi:MAG TPA: phenylalanine--tRNA ligase subunit beta, partial [Leifsonia sp.]
MRVPLSWLGEYVDLEPGTTPDEVHAALVSVGLEEEDVHTFEISGPVVVGQVLEFVEEPQSNGKTIRWCQVRVAPDGQKAADGGDAVHGIVCGASNFFAGDKVVVTLPGSVLPGPFPIAARKTYGHVSDGMIASARELGLGDEHAGILRLATLGLDPEVGTDAISLLGLDDSAVEVNVTPDRGYAFSIRGIAREYSHATGAQFRDPAEAAALMPLGAHAHGFSVRIEDSAPIRGRVGATVFVTRVVRDIDGSRPTPAWMIARLKLAGIRSISLVVDITNYVMLELGQPIHGYDLDKVEGGIVVRRAHPGEKLVTLDDQSRTLDPEDLLITDDSGPIGLAGVMGGASTEIGPQTTAVLIEAANFDPVSIARTARRHKLPSEASKRFERGVDPRVAVAAAARVVQLLEQLAGGHADELGSLLDDAAAPTPIRLPKRYIQGLVGVDFTDDEVRGALAEIGGQVTESGDALLVVPPSWRPDLQDKSDLAEEVARIVGYDRIPSILPVAPPGRGLSREQHLRRGVSQMLADNGAVEVLAFPFVSEKANDAFGSVEPVPGGVPAVRLANALDATAPFLRRSLLPGLVEIAHRNVARGLVDVSIYEIGTVFLPDGGALGSADLPLGAALPETDVLTALNAGIPAQPRHLAGLVIGHPVLKQPGRAAEPAGIADALTMVAQAAAAVGVVVEPVQG